MSVKRLLIAGLALMASGCVHHYPPLGPGRSPGPDLGGLAGGVIGGNIARGDQPDGSAALRKCRAEGNCVGNPALRQYYDQRQARYYFFDRETGRYYWENGEPRF